MTTKKKRPEDPETDADEGVAIARDDASTSSTSDASVAVEEAAETPAEPRTVEGWREAKATPEWAFEAAKMLHRWPVGRVLSESEYDAAVDAAMHVPISGHPMTPTRRARRK